MIAALALALAASQPASASGPPVRTVVFDRPEMAAAPANLAVGSGSFAPGGTIPLANSGYGKNLAPSVSWTAGPPKTRSYVVIVEDADNVQARPLLHWLAYDIPADVHMLPAKTKNLARTVEPIAFSQAVNGHEGLGYTGPHPDEGDPPHHYHFQVFALDRTKVARPGASFEEVLPALRGHVLAKGETIGLFAQKPPRQRREKGDKAAPEASPPAPRS